MSRELNIRQISIAKNKNFLFKFHLSFTLYNDLNIKNSKERRKPMKFLVIPAFEPDEKLIKLLEEVSALNLFQIIVVDDGSGDKFNNILRLPIPKMGSVP